MLVRLTTLSAALALAIALCCAGRPAYAQVEQSIALKSGEQVDLQPVYWIVNCRSILTALPVAEILEGPPGLTVSIREAMVLPRQQQCAQEVPGGFLVLSAKEIKERAEGRVTIRVKYPTKDGERQTSRVVKVSLFP